MKNKIIGIFFLLLFFTSACGTKGVKTDEYPEHEDKVEIMDEEEEANPEEDIEQDTEKDKEDGEYTINDFFAASPDVEYIYEGDGGEFSSYKEYIDFFNEDKKQVRSLNGGTEVVYIVEKTQNELKRIFEMAEVYYKENFLSKDSNMEKILIKRPIKVGTKWDNNEFGQSEITSIDKNIETGFGTLKAVEVTTTNMVENNKTLLKEYYAKGVGLVKSVYKDELYEENVILKEINENKEFKSTINLYYPNAIEDRLFLYKKEIAYTTNDIPRKRIEKLYKKYPDEVGPVLTENSKINYLYLNKDGMAYIDLSKDFIKEMNAGSGIEAMILQSLANTVGDYFGVEKVMLTIEGDSYESGHILLEEFEPIEVNYDGIVDKN